MSKWASQPEPEPEPEPETPMGFSPKQENILAGIMIAGVLGLYGGLIALAVGVFLTILGLLQ